MMYSHTHTQVGFSLVETLVAITILLIVIVGPMTLIVSSSQSTEFANEQIIAFFLAQEGLEIAQAARDDLQLDAFSATPPASTAWQRFTDTSGSGAYRHCFGSNGACGLDLNTDSAGSYNLYDCRSNTDNCRLYYDATPHERARYTHDDNSGSNQETKFTRIITMIETTTEQVEVVSTVTWRTDGQREEQEVVATTYLFDIYGI